MNENFLKIIESAKNGDENAFNQLFTESQQVIYYTCLKTVNNEQDAMDLTQEIFLKIYKNLSSLKNNETYFSWLKIMIANTCKNHLTRGNRDILLEEEEYNEVILNEPERDTVTIPQEALENKGTEEIMMSIFAKLPEAQRLCIIMYYYDEMSIREISSALNVSENTVKSRLNYAKKNIETEVRKQENENGLKLYGVAPLFLLKSLFLKEANSLPAPDINTSKIKWGSIANENIKSRVTNKILKKISANPLKAKIISAACVAAIVCVPAAIIGTKVVNKLSTPTSASVSQKELSTPEKVVTKFLNASMKNDFSTMYDCCDYYESDFVNKKMYTKYKESRSPSNIKSFKIIKDGDESPNEVLVEFEFTDTIPDYNKKQTFTVTNVSESKKPTYKIVTDDGLYSDYKIWAPLGATVSIDGIEVKEEYAEKKEEDTYGEDGLKYVYCEYTVPSMFLGDHTAKAEADFMATLEKPVDFNQRYSNFLSFDISESFKTEAGEILKSATKKYLESAFAKSYQYQNIVPEFTYKMNPKVESLRETYNGICNKIETNKDTGYKNYQVKGEPDINFEVQKGTIIISIKQGYEYDYMLYIARLTTWHQSGNTTYSYHLVKGTDGWEIIGADTFF